MGAFHQMGYPLQVRRSQHTRAVADFVAYIDADIVVELGVDLNIVMFFGKSNPDCCHHKNN